MSNNKDLGLLDSLLEEKAVPFNKKDECKDSCKANNNIIKFLNPADSGNDIIVIDEEDKIGDSNQVLCMTKYLDCWFGQKQLIVNALLPNLTLSTSN
jgi:hypothetical protein